MSRWMQLTQACNWVCPLVLAFVCSQHFHLDLLSVVNARARAQALATCYIHTYIQVPEHATWIGHELGGLASHQCRWAGVVWVPRCRDLRDELLAGVGCSSLTLRFSWTVTLIILGLGFLRARVLRLCCIAEGLLVLQDVGTMKSLHCRCEMWFDCVERKRSGKLPWSATDPCTFAAVPSFQACLRVFIYTFCMCVCIYVYVCMRADMYICIYMHVCVYLYIYAFIHVCMCMCMHVCA